MGSDLKFLNALNCIPGVGPATLQFLKNHFGSYEEAFRASDSLLETLPLDPRAKKAIQWKRPSINPDREMERMIRDGVWLLGMNDNGYPSLLKEIPNPPAVLYGRGTLAPLATLLAIGVVGTRKPTQYGLEATAHLVSDLARNKIVIVSGLATGIDTRAHETALESTTPTIGALGSGLDYASLFPQENVGLARRIVDSGGAIISEYALGTPALKEHFPQRNRIIAGLSRGVLIVEAKERSGALITARFALEQNREVFALPGSIFSLNSAGTHRLIQEGAKLVRTAEDLLEELGIEYTNGRTRAEEAVGERERMLLELLHEPLAVDFIKEKTGFETAAIVTSLSLLELKGLVRNMGSDTYQKIA